MRVAGHQLGGHLAHLGAIHREPDALRQLEHVRLIRARLRAIVAGVDTAPTGRYASAKVKIIHWVGSSVAGIGRVNDFGPRSNDFCTAPAAIGVPAA
jgi:hypothetical protein